jgi:hypothetical protein
VDVSHMRRNGHRVGSRGTSLPCHRTPPDRRQRAGGNPVTHDDHDCAGCHHAPGIYLRKMGRLGWTPDGGVSVVTLLDLVCVDCLPPKDNR